MSKPYTVVRTITAQAPNERVRSMVNDFHEWPRWSPMKVTGDTDQQVDIDLRFEGLAKLKSAAESA